MRFQFRNASIRRILSWALILGLFFELSLRIATAWKEPRGRFMWMLGKNRLQLMGQRDGYRFFTGRKGQTVELGSVRIDFNDLGYRSKQKEILRKDPKAFRIACFGDSVTLGQYERDYGNTWPGAIERILSDPPLSKKVEVFNFGMAHYTYTTNLVNLALIGEYLQPDIVIFLIGPNDFVCLYTRDYAPDGSHDGQWLLPIADATWGFHPIGRILQHSRVCNLLYGTAARVVLLLDASKRFNFKLSEENLPPRLEKMGDHLATFCALSKALGAAPVLCTYLYNEKRLLEVRGKDFRPVLDGIDETLRRVAEKEGALLVEAKNEMKDHPEFFLDDFHLTARGGGEFARIVVRALEDKGLLPPETGLVPVKPGSEY
jgi:lysophospholipase L1-like esterase